MGVWVKRGRKRAKGKGGKNPQLRAKHKMTRKQKKWKEEGEPYIEEETQDSIEQAVEREEAPKRFVKVKMRKASQ